MGMGHLFRMITLYGALRHKGASATIVLLGKHLPSSEWLERSSIPCQIVEDATTLSGWEKRLALQYGAQVWVNDRLHTDADHARRIKDMGLWLVTFDDLGGGAALADLHVSALAGVRGETPSGVKVLTGLEYLLVSQDIAHFRRQRTECHSRVVTLGGSDTHGVTLMVARWLSIRQQPGTLILGPGFEHEGVLSTIVSDSITVKRSVPSLAAEFAAHDLAITGGGLTAFEATAAGLPTITVANETWEVAHCRYLQGRGCSLFAGRHDAIDFSVFEKAPDVQTMSRVALDTVDVNGVDRVCAELVSLVN